MKLKEAGGLIIGTLAMSALAGLAMVIFRVPVETLQTALLMLAGGVALAIVLVGVAFALRGWRSTGPQEIQRIIERVEKHTLDGRVPEAPKIHLLNQQPNNAGMFPDVLRAAYLAGVRGLPSGEGEIIEGETRDLTNEWRGEIRD